MAKTSTNLNLKLKRLKLKAGDVLVLHIDMKDMTMNAIQSSLQGWMKKNGLARIPIMILNRNETVETVSEARLRDMGWIRPYEVIQ